MSIDKLPIKSTVSCATVSDMHLSIIVNECMSETVAPDTVNWNRQSTHRQLKLSIRTQSTETVNPHTVNQNRQSNTPSTETLRRSAHTVDRYTWHIEPRFGPRDTEGEPSHRARCPCGWMTWGYRRATAGSSARGSWRGIRPRGCWQRSTAPLYNLQNTYNYIYTIPRQEPAL